MSVELRIGDYVRLNVAGQMVRGDHMKKWEGTVEGFRSFPNKKGDPQRWVLVDWGLDDEGNSRFWYERPEHLAVS